MAAKSWRAFQWMLSVICIVWQVIWRGNLVSDLTLLFVNLRLADDGNEVTILHIGKLKPVKFNHPNITVHYIYMPSDEDVVSFVNSFLWKRSRFVWKSICHVFLQDHPTFDLFFSHADEPPMVMSLGDAYVHRLLDENSDSVSRLFYASE